MAKEILSKRKVVVYLSVSHKYHSVTVLIWLYNVLLYRKPGSLCSTRRFMSTTAMILILL